MDGFTSNLEWEVSYPEGISTTKMVNFCLAIIELRMHENAIFLVPVKCILVCRTPALVYLAVQHTIVGLDIHSLGVDVVTHR